MLELGKPCHQIGISELAGEVLARIVVEALDAKVVAELAVALGKREDERVVEALLSFGGGECSRAMASSFFLRSSESEASSVRNPGICVVCAVSMACARFMSVLSSKKNLPQGADGMSGNALGLLCNDDVRVSG